MIAAFILCHSGSCAVVDWNVCIYCLAHSSYLNLNFHRGSQGEIPKNVWQQDFPQLMSAGTKVVSVFTCSKRQFPHPVLSFSCFWFLSCHSSFHSCFSTHLSFFLFFFLAPSGPPENFEVKPLRGKGTAVIATWDEPEEPNGRIRGQIHMI